MIRLIASDLDGTLLKNGAQDLNPRLFELIDALKQQGIRFAAASGRQYANLYRLFGPVRDDISYIAENGSLCVHENAILSSGNIDRDLVNEIVLDARKQPDCSLLFSCKDHCYVEKGNERLYDHVKNHVGYDTILADDLTLIPDTCLKVAICNFDGAYRSMGYFTEKYADRIKIVTSGNIWFDFIAPNANKGTALAGLADHFGISREECAAFGDQFNDVEMLQFAGTSYAMSDCAAGVETYATHRTDSVEKILEQILDGTIRQEGA